MGMYTPRSEALCRSLSDLLHPGEELACVEEGFGFKVMGHHKDTGTVSLAYFGETLARLGRGVLLDLIEDGLFEWRLNRNRAAKGGE